MRFYFKHINKLSRSEVERLKQLAFKDGGDLRKRLARRKYDVLSVVCISKNSKGKIIGWLAANTYYSNNGCCITLSVFIDHHYRRRGIGRELVSRFEMMVHVLIEGKNKIIMVNTHSNTAREFWKSLGYKRKEATGIHWNKKLTDG